MTIRCVKCHRKLTRPPVNGMGPVCAKGAKPIPAHDRDLFGYAVAQACEAASARVRVHVESLAIDAVIAMRHQVNAARRRLVVWRG